MKKINTIFERKYYLLLMFVLIISSVSTRAQEKTDISGTITDGSIPLLGVNVLVQGSNRGAVSDFDGNYVVSASKGEVLVFSSIGFISQTVVVGDKTVINVVLETSSQELEQVVVIGYGTQRKIEVTGAVTNISSETIARAPVSDVGEALQGQVAGVNIQASNGRPGEAANIQIRGVGSLNAGSNGPLFVVDGVPFQANPNIAPEQIQSIDILKDGAAAAVYGTRASNGVILITTKQGKKGQLRADYSTYLAIQNITSGIPLMNTQQQFFYTQVTDQREGSSLVDQIFDFNANALNVDNDFIEDVQKNNALIQNHNINVSGGVNDLTLNLSGNFFDQEGVLINSGFNRLTTRITGQYKRNRLKVFSSVSITDELREQEPFALLERAISQRPFQPAISSTRPVDGVVNLGDGTGQPELLGFLTRELASEDKRRVRSSNVALNIEYEVLEGLTYRANLGRNTFDFRRKFLQPQYLLFDNQGNFVPTASREDAMLQESFIFSQRSTVENSLNYYKDFGKHNIKLLGLTSFEQFDSSTVNTGVIGLLSNDTDTLGAGEEGIKPNGSDDRQILTGLLGRIQYNYDDRYLISASYRRDGSSQFGPSNRFGDFFGVSLGWNVSEEPFFENANIDFINNFKLRASWGEVGNSRIDSFLFTPIIEPGVNGILGREGQIAIGQIGRRFVDPNIKWETSISRNIGLDLSFFSNKFSITADYYVNNQEDLLLGEQLPPSLGGNAPGDSSFNERVVNAGNLTNKGFELAMSYKGQTEKGLKWNVSGTFTTNDNEITDLNGTARGFQGGVPLVTQGTDPTTFLAEGFEAGAFFLLENNGVIKTQEQLDAYNSTITNSSARLGDIMYIDQNGDNLIDENDRVYAGSGQAEWEAGLSISLDYKGFDFYLQNYVSYGAEIYNGARLAAYAYDRHLDLFNQWSPENPNSDIPADIAGTITENVRSRSDYFVEDGSYWRIRNITLGYSIPEDSLPESIRNVRVYVTGQNPFTFTEYTGFDPEVGGDGIFTRGVDLATYPVSRRFLFGVQLGF
ncbi:TonB-dependent receptor [Aquimarina sp. RZ0]|uniref:SusC/RagA family TonB-linked outer membrane protein n=1 Tax=Aquimarina sp. RZ0 TaxID=2607730 RepID=UPI0011F3AD77|nr:TonB-dependent receptor [Aquimarina sp. RZ0]KAA1243299.1 TonB-dependent receptor [Aquimarina sp. RZ0]